MSPAFCRQKMCLCPWFALLLGALGAAALRAQPDFAPGQLLVRLKDPATNANIEALHKRHGLTLKKRIRNGNALAVARSRRGDFVLFETPGALTPALERAIANDPAVAYAEPNYTRELYSLPNDTNIGLLWGLHNTGQSVNGVVGTAGKDIHYPEASILARATSPEVVVGVTDSGMSIRHPDLLPNIWTHPTEIPANGIDDDGNGYIDDVHGYDFGTDSPRMVDADGHGTHVAGTIGAASNNGIGVSGVLGSARLVPMKIASADGTLYVSDVVEAFLYAAALKNSGINLVAVNASFGGPSYTQAEYDAIAEMNAAGVILCAAAGNETTDNDLTPSYPASYDLPNILSVAAIDQHNHLASFSNYGATTVDLAAPGVNILSTLPLDQLAYASSVVAGGTVYGAATITHAGITTAGGLTGAVVACGLGYPGDFPPGVDGNIALIQRGELTFSAKVQNAMAAGAVGALIFNNTAVPPGNWTLGYEDAWIPALQLTQSNGESIAAALPLTASLYNTTDLGSAYWFLHGTSMATPHVAGAVAFAALNFPGDSVTQRIARVLDNVTPVAGLAGLVASGGVLNLQRLTDTDLDGLPDWWENDYFGHLANNGNDNSDGDRFTTAEEYLSLTDPTSGSSFLALFTSDAGPADGATLRFQTAPGRTYQILWSNDLNTGSWAILQDAITGDGSIFELFDAPAETAVPRFYQLRLLDL